MKKIRDRPIEMQERDKEIVNGVANNESYSSIARRIGLSCDRVRQIYIREMRETNYNRKK